MFILIGLIFYFWAHQLGIVITPFAWFWFYVWMLVWDVVLLTKLFDTKIEINIH